MQQINLSKSIGFKIKEYRIKYNVKSKELAEAISMSPAYISKLECGKAKKIPSETLKKIVNYITHDETEYEKFLTSLFQELEENDIAENEWLCNFDTIIRKIPVSRKLIDYINSEMATLKISTKDLVDLINLNSDLDESFFTTYNIDKNTVKKNCWHSYKNIDATMKYSTYIILELSEELVNNLLSFKEQKSNYIVPFVIIYHILKIKNNFPQEELILSNLKVQTESILNSYKFYRLKDKVNFTINQDINKKLLTHDDKETLKILSIILNHFNALATFDISYANEKFNTFEKNLSWDPGFSLALCGLKFYSLNNISVHQKKRLLHEINSLINKYLSKPESEKSIEEY